MRTLTVAAAVCCAVVGLSTAGEVAAAIRQPTRISAQGLEPALQILAKDRDLQIVYRSEVVGEVRTPGASGEFTTDEALRQLLTGTGLTFQYIDEQTITIIRTNGRTPTGRPTRTPAQPHATINGKDANAATSERGKSFWDRFRLTQADLGKPAESAAVEESTNAAGSQRGSVQLEEIIVTATKRAESVQDVPMSITAIGGQDIERRGLVGMEDYLRSIPGVNQIDNGPKSNAIVIRGITTAPEFENGLLASGVTVGAYFDETPVTGAAGVAGGGIDLRPVDMERIEVLRGPQGTAYGSQSLSGTLRMIPTKPQLDRFSGRLSASYSGTSGGGSGNSMIQGVVNLPLVEDELAVRVVGYRYDDSGFYRNIAGADPATLATLQTFGLGDLINGYVQDHVGDLRSTGGRLSASWKVTDDLNLTMNVLTQKLEQNGTPAATVGSFDQVAIPIAAPGRVRGEAGDVNDTKINLANLVLSYDLQWAAVTSAVSWVDSGSAQTTSGLAPFPFSTTLRPSDFKSFTAETRLASHLEGRFQFISGLFYENVEEQHLGTTYWPGTPETSPLGTAVLFTSSVARDRDQRALFGEVSYDLTSQLTATVGGRHFEYDKDEQSQLVFAGTPSGSSDLNSSESGNTFKASLSYEPTDRSLLYASWAEGFRLGRPQAGLPSAACDVNGDGLIDGTGTSIESTRRVESDSLENYEVGSKLSLFDRRIVMDAAVYHIDWEGLPIGVTVGCTLVGYTANAGRARSDGAELQASVLVAEGLRVDFGGSYTKARLAEDAPALNAEKGARLPGSPKVNANLAVQYDFLLAGHEAFVRADSLYTGDFYGDLQESAQTRAGDYIKLDARVGVRLKSLSVEAFVRNLTNEAASTWRSVSPQTGLFSDYRLRPRTVGIQLGYSFE